MTTKNPITGDELKTKPSTDAFRAGWDRIFGKGCGLESKDALQATSAESDSQAVHQDYKS